MSITSLSHDEVTRPHLDSVYGMDHKFDLLKNDTARTFALRLYVDLLVHKLIGFNQTFTFMQRLLLTRYTGLDDLFPYWPSQRAELCDGGPPSFGDDDPMQVSGFEHLYYPPSHADGDVAPSVRKRGAFGGVIPTARHVYGDATMDVKLLAPHFMALAPEHRDTLMMDYFEELAAQVVGANRTYAFFKYCFAGQTYALTSVDDRHHAMWS